MLNKKSAQVGKNYTTGFLVVLVFILSVVLFINAEDYVTAMIAFNDTNITQATVVEQNIAPTVESIQMNSGANIDLVGGGTKNTNCTAIINDNNGRDDMKTDARGNVTFYSSETVNTCHASPGDSAYRCYYNGTYNSVDLTSICINHNTTAVNCTFTTDLYYNSENTTWQCYMAISDAGGMSGTATSGTIDVNDLTAININSTTMDFGSVSPGSVSGEAVMQVLNYGNIQLDLKLNGSDMVCDTGSKEAIVVGNISYNITGASPVWGTTNLTNEISAAKDINIFPNETVVDADPTATYNNTWWRLYMPPSSQGARGSCSGTIWFIGTAG